MSSEVITNYSAVSLGSALKKGLQQPQAGLTQSSHLDGASKATIVLLSLGPDRAARILKAFSPAEAQKVSSLMSSVRSIDRDVIIQVLQDFKSSTEHLKKVPFDADLFVNSLVQKFSEDQDEAGWSANSEVSRSLPALQMLSKMTPVMLQQRLSDEHPQVSATLLSLLEPTLSASVLDLLDEETRNELMLRVALLDRIDPAVLSELNEVLEKSLDPAAQPQMSSIGGTLPVAEILGYLTGGADRRILSVIGDYDKQLAEQIAAKMFIFEDFALIATEALQRLLPEVPTEALVVALKGEAPALRERFMSCMSKRQAERVQFEMNTMAPVKVQDVEAQHREIIRIARQMADDGLISLERTNASAASAQRSSTTP